MALVESRAPEDLAQWARRVARWVVGEALAWAGLASVVYGLAQVVAPWLVCLVVGIGLMAFGSILARRS